MVDWISNTQKLDWQLKDEQQKSSWLDFYQKMPWSPFTSAVAGAVGRGIQKLPEVLERPEVERWVRPGVTTGAKLWSPYYMMKDKLTGRPALTPEGKRVWEWECRLCKEVLFLKIWPVEA